VVTSLVASMKLLSLRSPGQLCLVILPFVDRMSIDDGYGFQLRLWKNGKFCVTIGPVTRTASIHNAFYIDKTT